MINAIKNSASQIQPPQITVRNSVYHAIEHRSPVANLLKLIAKLTANVINSNHYSNSMRDYKLEIGEQSFCLLTQEEENLLATNWRNHEVLYQHGFGNCQQDRK